MKDARWFVIDCDPVREVGRNSPETQTKKKAVRHVEGQQSIVVLYDERPVDIERRYRDVTALIAR